MTKQDADASNDVVTGTISMFSRDVRVLFDSGATHSFISMTFACYASKNTEPLGYYLSIATPMGDSMMMNQVYKSCLISLGNRDFLVDLLPIEMHDFDVILGMNWLSTYHASIECFSKEIVFKIPGKKEFRFQGRRSSIGGLISALKARKMLAKGCEAFLACVMADRNGEVSLGDISVVREFLDVFPEDLPGLPLDREIEFSIDLLPGTVPISKAPYRMAPIELKELKVQL